MKRGQGDGDRVLRQQGDVNFSKAFASARRVLTKSQVVVISSLDLINLEGAFQENCDGQYIRCPSFLPLNLASPQIEQNFIAEICSVHLTSILTLRGSSRQQLCSVWWPRPDLPHRGH